MADNEDKRPMFRMSVPDTFRNVDFKLAKTAGDEFDEYPHNIIAILSLYKEKLDEAEVGQADCIEIAVDFGHIRLVQHSMGLRGYRHSQSRGHLAGQKLKFIKKSTIINVFSHNAKIATISFKDGLPQFQLKDVLSVLNVFMHQYAFKDHGISVQETRRVVQAMHDAYKDAYATLIMFYDAVCKYSDTTIGLSTPQELATYANRNAADFIDFVIDREEKPLHLHSMKMEQAEDLIPSNITKIDLGRWT